MCGSNVLFVMTGSIACYKACEVVSRLVQAGHRVRVVATEAALKFVGASTLEGLSGSAVSSDLWETGKAMEHIQLTRWADVVVVCPATANTLSRLAAGMGDNLVGALFLAHERTKPWLVAPAMNPAMWSHPATVTAVDKLRAWGVRFVPVGEGRTACGERGDGRMAEPGTVVLAVEAALARPARPLSVLITSGGTAEPIDGVRVLTNTSTGRTGVGLAGYFVRCGHSVTLLRAEASAVAPSGVRTETFGSFAELDQALGRLLGTEDFDAVIHAAAVGDFAVESVIVEGRKAAPGTKLGSELPVILALKSQPKLVTTLRTRSRQTRLRVVAFKLTHGASEDEADEAVRRLFGEAGADWVVHNDLAARTDSFPATIHLPGGNPVPCADRQALAETLESLLTLDTLPA